MRQSMSRKRADDTMLGSYASGIGGGRSGKKRVTARMKVRELFAPDKDALIEADEDLAKAKEADTDVGEYLEKCLRHLWQAVEDDRVLLSFAAVGYDYSTGFPVYDYDILVDLLINYGYNVDVATMFAGELSRSKWRDGTRRVVMNSSRRVDIYSQVEKLPDNPCS